MVTVKIRGKEFPLCLTVAAVDAVNTKCGSLKQLGGFLDGKDESGAVDFGRAMHNTAWMLCLLLREGEENRLVCARFDGAAVERRAVPDSEAVCHLLTVATAKKYRSAVLDAVHESMTQDIEAEHSKNGEHAEQK